MSSLKDIDKFAIKFYQSQYCFEDFVREKEAKTSITYFQSPEESENNIEEDLDLGESEEDNEVMNKLDLDQAYEMYLSKKKDIMRTFELMSGADSTNQNPNQSNLNLTNTESNL
jgi:hypothetical protein